MRAPALFLLLASTAGRLLEPTARAGWPLIQAVSIADPGLAKPASAGGDSLGSVISPDGSFVVFMSDADNLVTNRGNGLALDVFLRRRAGGATSSGYASRSPVISDNGGRVASSSADTEQDGLADGWELECLGSLSRDGSADADADGLTDREEYRAGTGPMDRMSALDCTASMAGDGATELSWNAAPGRAYRVHFKDDPGASSWAELRAATQILGLRAKVSDQFNLGRGQRFYRIVLID